MPRFDDDAFEEALRLAILHHEQFADEYIWPVPKKTGGWEPDDDERNPELVTLQTVITAHGLDSPVSGPPEMPASEFVEMVAEARAGKKLDRSTLATRNQLLVYVEPANDLSWALITDEVDPHADVSGTLVAGASIANIDLVSGPTAFHFWRLYQPEEHFSDYMLGYDDGDTFVVVRHGGNLNEEKALAAAHAFLFEIAAELGLVFKRGFFAGRADPEVWYDPDEASVKHIRDTGTSIRPAVGTALAQVQQAFLQAEREDIPVEYRVLEYTKVLEFISATIVRREAHEALKARLRAPTVKSPDAPFLDGLLNLVEQQQVYRRDSEGLKLTILRCVDHLLLRPLFPDFLEAKIDKRSKKADELGARAFAECISATRNQICHAKSNYELTGAEAPQYRLDSLIPALRLAALLALRWFIDLPPAMRVGGR